METLITISGCICIFSVMGIGIYNYGKNHNINCRELIEMTKINNHLNEYNKNDYVGDSSVLDPLTSIRMDHNSPNEKLDRQLNGKHNMYKNTTNSNDNITHSDDDTIHSDDEWAII